MTDTAPPQLWVLAGGNGAGKTTFYQYFLQPHGIPFLNADNIARDVWPEDPESHSYEAARLAEEMRYRHVRSRATFCFETVFSHPSKIDFIAYAKAHDYQIILVYVHLQADQLNCARVASRKARGGHKVPENKIRSRLPRTLANVRAAIPLCDVVKMYDNSDNEYPYIPVLEIRHGRVVQHAVGYPWSDRFLPGSTAGQS